MNRCEAITQKHTRCRSMATWRMLLGHHTLLSDSKYVCNLHKRIYHRGFW